MTLCAIQHGISSIMSSQSSRALLLFVIIVFATRPTRPRPQSCKADKYANGCSIPLGILAPYKEQFTPACNKHDICYGCVSINLMYSYCLYGKPRTLVGLNSRYSWSIDQYDGRIARADFVTIAKLTHLFQSDWLSVENKVKLSQLRKTDLLTIAKFTHQFQSD